LFVFISDFVIQDLEVCAKYIILYCMKNTQPVAVVINAVHQREPYFIVSLVTVIKVIK